MLSTKQKHHKGGILLTTATDAGSSFYRKFGYEIIGKVNEANTR